MFETIFTPDDAGLILAVAAGIIVLSVVGVFVLRLLRVQKKDKYSQLLIDKTEGAQKRAKSVILDTEARAMKDAGRDERRVFDFVNWYAIRRDLKKAGLPAFPPLVVMFALVLAVASAYLVVAAPIYPMYAQVIALYPPMYYLARTSFLEMRIESRRMKMTQQLILFIETVQRSVSVGTSPDEGVVEAIRETENPLREKLAAIKDLIDLGYDFVDAINLAADRINLPEFDIFAASLTAQSKTGGTVGEVLKEVIDITRARMDLQKKIATMTGEGRFNAILLGSLPIGLTVYLRTVQPEYFNTIWAAGTTGAMVFFATLAFAVFGAFFAMRLARIKV